MEASSRSATQAADTSNEPESTDLPSCEGCRKRKLKCSRQLPLCSNCERLDTPCVYDGKKTKPGVKSGAVESLNRRLEIVENALLEKQKQLEIDERAQVNANNSVKHRTPQSTARVAHASTAESQVVDVLSSLSNQIQKLSSAIESNGFGPQNREDSSFNRNIRHASQHHREPHHKRRRLHEDTIPSPSEKHNGPTGEDERSSDFFSSPLRVARLKQLLDVFFDKIQPWIPMLHIARFPRLLEDPAQQRRKSVVLHAMQVVTLRHLKDLDGSPLAPEHVEREVKRSRDIVMLSAMDGLSVENLQALTLIAFSDVGNGEPQKAWPIIGSLTRTVEYLNLTVESEDSKPRGGLLQPRPTPSRPKDWVEEEERRRVFWNIFNLDRFCSITTGSNTSLTAADVSRRLPVCGGIWYHGEPAMTPYFGIWDRSAARIGNSITFLPEHYPSPSHTIGTSPDVAKEAPTPKPSDAARHAKQTSQVGQHVGPDMSNVGAFAYYIESLESLSRITAYFLQQEVNLQDRQQLTAWLTRFKELDLRLVHWKMFLPHQWQDSGISRETMPGIMDPNMTVAHTTHNTSMILLHQRIAYPTKQLKGVKLPSLYSAETCQSAATETAIITKSYLEKSSPETIVSPPMAFAAFVSARVLLVHSRYYKRELHDEFWTLVSNLDEMHLRWLGPQLPDGKPASSSSLFGQFTTRLRGIYDRFKADPLFTIDVSGQFDDPTWEELPTLSSRDFDSSPAVMSHKGDTEPMAGTLVSHASQSQSQKAATTPRTSDITNTHAPHMQPWQWSQPSLQPNPTEGSAPGREMDDLSAISQVLMGQQFMDMDRVISFEDIMQPSWEPARGTNLEAWQNNHDEPGTALDNGQRHMY